MTYNEFMRSWQLKTENWILRAKKKDQQIDLKRWLILFRSVRRWNADRKADVEKFEYRMEYKNPNLNLLFFSLCFYVICKTKRNRQICFINIFASRLLNFCRILMWFYKVHIILIIINTRINVSKRE